jgi:streptogramin lyase
VIVATQRHVGKYEILEEIGRGGFAVVYRARDTTLDRVVALKILHPQLTIDPKFVQRFHQEAQTAAGLHHSHIVTIYEVGQEAGQHYLAMAFLPGRTLDERLTATRGALPVELATSIVEQIADALGDIRRRGLVHRDIKPANIMVDDEGHATLLDFGIVRAAEGTRLTTTMAILGTPEYMAPEQADPTEVEEIDWRADVYALGVVAYEMLVGRPPFTGKSPTKVLYQHVHEPPPSPGTLNPDLPTELEPVLLKALAKQREERFQGAGAFAVELRRALLTESQMRMREKQLTPLYEQLQTAVAKKQWTEVLALGGQIQSLEAGYRDVPQLMSQAHEQLQRPRRRPMPVWGCWAVAGGVIGALLLGLGMILGPRLFGPTGPADTPTVVSTGTPSKPRMETATLELRTEEPTEEPTITPLEALPAPLAERVTAAGTWTVSSYGDDVQDLAFHGDLLWAATNGGAVVWDTERGTFLKYTTLDGLANNNVQAVAAGPDGALWFGTGWFDTGGGVSRYDPGTGDWRTFTTADGLASNDVQAVAAGPGGALWFGTWGGGVSRYDPGAGDWQTFTTADGLASNYLRAVAAGPDGALWFGTNGSGVSRYDPGTGDWRTFTTADGLADNDVQAVAAGPDGALWFGTPHGGVSRYDPGTGDWQTFTTAAGLTGSDVRAVVAGPDGALWFGTWGGGVSRYDPGTGVWQTFTTANGLASNYVGAVAAGPGGALWFGTQGGVSRYDPGTGAQQTFTTADGLASNCVGAVAAGPDGALWFGTSGGVSRFEPTSP